MPGRSPYLSALLIVATIVAGLVLRLAHFGLPWPLVKYGGSILWALMVYWITSSIRPRWAIAKAAMVAGVAIAAVELFKLYHAPALDAFRSTLPGALLLGRFFSLWDLVTYAFAIVGGALVDHMIRSR